MNRITLYHGYPPLPDITPNDKSVMSSLKANLSYLNQQISNMENSLNDIREELVKCGFHESRVHVIFKARRKEIGAEIIELAHKNHYDLIVLNRISGRISRYFTNSVYQRVIASLKNTAVCVVS